VHVQSEMMNNQLTAPTRIPHNITIVAEREAPPSSFGVAGNGRPWRKQQRRDRQHVWRGIQGEGGPAQEGEHLGRRHGGHAGSKDHGPSIRPLPRPPASQARWCCRLRFPSRERSRICTSSAARPLLQQAAMDAVKTWRYRPYLLNNEPVEVETTVNVIFTLGG